MRNPHFPPLSIFEISPENHQFLGFFQKNSILKNVGVSLFVQLQVDFFQSPQHCIWDTVRMCSTAEVSSYIVKRRIIIIFWPHEVLFFFEFAVLCFDVVDWGVTPGVSDFPRKSSILRIFSEISDFLKVRYCAEIAPAVS